MTKRDFLNSVVNGTVGAEEVAFAAAEIEKMNARNEKRANTPSKAAIANEPIKAEIKKMFVDNSVTLIASVVGQELGISTQKASYLLRDLEGEHYIVGEKVKSKAPVAYHLA